jgi:hypothetical protein
MRGGERVLEALRALIQLFTLLHVRGSSCRQSSGGPSMRHFCSIYPSGITRQCLPLFPALIEQFDLERFIVVAAATASRSPAGAA